MENLEYLSDSEAVSMSDDWFEFAQADHFWMQWRLKAILQQKKYLPANGSLIFEVGCGNGIVMNQLEKELNYTVDGCDLNVKALSMALPSKGRKMVYNIFDLKEDLLGKYDGLLLLDVLEHINDDVSFLETAAKYVKPGGIIIINVPAHQWLYSNYDQVVGHVRRYSTKSLRELIIASKLAPVKVTTWGTTMLPIAMIRKVVLAGKKDLVIKSGFQAPNKLADNFLHFLKNFETGLPFALPSGTSAIAICKVPTQ
jgi:2-polyprenyl-3-methyl-5-hydroxy-6-metoxy-1,4-benzoquinol methylase